MAFAIPSASAGLEESSCVIGDADLDADADLEDFASFLACMADGVSNECGTSDFDANGSVDHGDFAILAGALTGPLPGLPTIRLDSPISPTIDLNVIVTGETTRACMVRVTGATDPVTVEAVDGAFVAPVLLKPNRINHMFVTALMPDGTSGAPMPVNVIHDQAPPKVFIDFPPVDSEITTSAIDVAGRVSDLLSGFRGLIVSVNGVAAEVDVGVGTNGTFLAAGVPLIEGQNMIQAVAIDEIGNRAEVQTSVIRTIIPDNVPQMQVHSGNGQRAPIGVSLPEPIVVQVINERNGLPFPGKIVTFTVTRSNGRLRPISRTTGAGQTTLQVRTDANGLASALWSMGTDAGCGNNRVRVTSTSIAGSVFFCATATPGPATQINVGTGGVQRAEAGGPACEPLRVWVNDSCNGVSGVPVTFRVVRGGGSIGGQSEQTIITSQTGHAGVALQLGVQPGLNTVEADFVGNSGEAATFVIDGLARQGGADTTFSGLVVTNANQPVQGAECRLRVGGSEASTISNLEGRFEFTAIAESGVGELAVNGLSATHVGGAGGFNVPPGSFPALTFQAIVVPHAQNALPMPVRLPQLNPNNARSYSLSQDTILTVEEIEGLQMTVRRGSMFIDGFPAPDGTIITLNQVHHDDIPMPMTDGAAPPFAWTLQPAGATFDPPIEIVYPNMSGLPAGAIAYFLSFDHDTERFEIVATGHVTADGSSIVSDPGAGLSLAGWGCNCPPYSVSGSCVRCNECQFNNGLVCIDLCLNLECCDGECCFGSCCGLDCCQVPQICCGDICCDIGKMCCGGACCEVGEECCGDVCCQPDGCNASFQCCGESSTPCNDFCCPKERTCCGITCCLEEECCDDGVCREASVDIEACDAGHCCGVGMRCCGDECCGPSEHCCQNPGGGSFFCSAIEPGSSQCPAGHCCSFGSPCCGDACCAPTECCGPDGCSSSICEDGGECCAGECCGLDAVCCTPQSGNPFCFSGEAEICSSGRCCALGEAACCGDECCNIDRSCCGEVCCEMGQQCCGDQCCAQGQCTGNGFCCADGTTVCGDACCGATQTCCEGMCCAMGQTCMAGVCQ